MFDALPFWREIAVLQIYRSCSDRIISEDIIVVHDLDNKWRASWEGAFELEAFEEVRVGLIFLVLVPLIVLLSSTTDD